MSTRNEAAPVLTCLVDAVGELATDRYPDGTPPLTPTRFTVTDIRRETVGVPALLDREHLHRLGTIATFARAEADRSLTGALQHGECAWCDPDPLPGSDHQPLARRVADAIGELFTNYPTGDEPTGSLHLTEEDSTRHSVPLKAGNAQRLADLVTEFNHYLSDDLPDDQCPRCGESLTEDNPFAPDPSLLY